MMKSILRAGIALALFSQALLLSGCAVGGGNDMSGGTSGIGGIGTKTILGTAIGGAAGGWVGSNIGHGNTRLATTAGGAILGALLAGAMGQSMDRADALYARQTAAQAFETMPTNQTAQWQNPDNGHYGTITPTQTYQTASGQYCREYTTHVNIGGQVNNAYGTACRQPDGSWQIVQ